jgi:hypothetical protein
MRILFAAIFLLFASPAFAATWHEAETAHFRIASAGDEKELRRLAERLEYFHTLLRLATGVSESGHPVVKVRVYLVDSVEDVKRLFGDMRSDVAGFYTPREDGAIAVVPRSTGDGIFTGQLVLFHEYSHHYMLQYSPMAYPAWYVEGFAEIASTASFERKGSITYGKAASHRQYELMDGMSYPAGKMLDGSYLIDNKKGRGWSYGDAWTLTHYLTFSDKRHGQFRAYLNAINAGKKMSEAATVFGNLADLQHEVNLYLSGRSFPYRAVPIPEGAAGPITIRTMSGAEAAMIDMAVEFERRTELPIKGDDPKLDDPKGDFDKRLADAKQARAEWITKVEAMAGRYPAETAGWLMLADARCAAEEYAACTAAAERALAIEPGNERAQVRKAEAMIRAARDLPDDQRKARVTIAQEMLLKANAADPNDPLALLWFYNSYGAMGKRADADGLDALIAVVQLIPQQYGPRLTLAGELMQRGRMRDAGFVLRPLAYSPHESTASRRARKMLDQVEAALGLSLWSRLALPVAA